MPPSKKAASAKEKKAKENKDAATRDLSRVLRNQPAGVTVTEEQHDAKVASAERRALNLAENAARLLEVGLENSQSTVVVRKGRGKRALPDAAEEQSSRASSRRRIVANKPVSLGEFDDLVVDHLGRAGAPSRVVWTEVPAPRSFSMPQVVAVPTPTRSARGSLSCSLCIGCTAVAPAA
jgi:hypothetical protein